MASESNDHGPSGVEMSYALEPIQPRHVTFADDQASPEHPLDEHPTLTLICELYSSTVSIGAYERSRLAHIHVLASRRVYEQDDMCDMYQWVAINLGIGSYRARKMVDCAHAIEALPKISRALEQGVLGLDKVVELTRFATPKDESKLITWARRVSVAAIRSRADQESRRDRQQLKDDTNDRFLRFNLHGDKMWMDGMVPADVGTEFKAAIDALADRLAPAPSDERPGAVDNPLEQRRMDALLQAVLDNPPPAAVVTEVVVHARLDDQGFTNGVDATGVVLHPDIVERLTCDCRLRFVLTDDDGSPTGIGQASRTVPEWLRQAVLKAYDFTCAFPGCDCQGRLNLHHIAHWAFGGPTDFYNLFPVCRRHHALLHEHDWTAHRGTRGTIVWYRPDGSRYLPGPAPPLSLAD